jgi:DNA-binding transcriptional MerR regulator
LNLDKKQYYSLRELCQLESVTERTVRYYIQEGLLPPPSGAGIFSRYGYEHRLRLQFIKRLKDEFLPLSEIKNLLANRSVADLEALANSPTPSAATGESNAEPRLEDWLERGESLRKKLSEQTERYAAGPSAASKAKMSPEPPTAKPLASPVPPPEGRYRTDQRGITPGAAPIQPTMQAGGFGAIPPPAPASMPAPAPQGGAFGLARSATPYYGGVEFSSANADIEPFDDADPLLAEVSANLELAKEAVALDDAKAEATEAETEEKAQSAPEQTELGERWEKVSLAPGVELHVESGVAQKRRNALEKLIQAAKELLK